MTTMKRRSMLALPVLLSLCGACGEGPGARSADGSNACPEAVTQSVSRDLPGATIRSCKAEKAEGRILQTETIIAVTDVPARVMAAFSAKYAGAKSTRAEKQVRAGKGTFYEINPDRSLTTSNCSPRAPRRAS